jgi:hypothetical protein
MITFYDDVILHVLHLSHQSPDLDILLLAFRLAIIFLIDVMSACAGLWSPCMI